MQTKLVQLVLFWFGIGMAALFLTGGFLFTTTGFLSERITEPNRTYAGYVLILYGGFRAYRQYAQYKKNKHEE